MSADGRPVGYVGKQKEPNLPQGTKGAPYGTDHLGWPIAPHGWVAGGRGVRKAAPPSGDPMKPQRPGGQAWEKATVPPQAKVDLGAAAAQAAAKKGQPTTPPQSPNSTPSPTGSPTGNPAQPPDASPRLFHRCNTCNTGVNSCPDCGRLQTPEITKQMARGPVMVSRWICNQMGEPLDATEEGALLEAVVELANFLRLFTAWVPFVMPMFTLAVVFGPRAWNWWHRRKQPKQPSQDVPATARSTGGPNGQQPQQQPRREESRSEAGGFA